VSSVTSNRDQEKKVVEVVGEVPRAVFGSTFTEHMASITWDDEVGWHDLEVGPMKPLSLHPATAVLHYGQEIFEGLKAYRQADGSARLFRIQDHAARFRDSARRMAMPELSIELFTRACVELVKADVALLGPRPGDGLYLRPMLISTTPELGAGRPSRSYLFMVIACPTPANAAVNASTSVWVTHEYVRAARGGTGAVKAGANYAQGMIGQAQARAHNCQQVAWLDPVQHEYVEELGAMNLFFVFGRDRSSHLVTPPLSDTILPGITRRSILTIAEGLGLSTEERPVSLAEWERLCVESTIQETFATGTAGGITPVQTVQTMSSEWTIGDGVLYPISSLIGNRLNELQAGVSSDAHGWLTSLDA